MFRLLTLTLLVVCILASASADESSLVVDISAIIENSETSEGAFEAAAFALDAALRYNGVAVLTGHGLNQDTLAKAFQASYDLFSLDMNAKKHVSLRNDDLENSFGRGYLGFGMESGLSDHFEPKEGYSYGHPRNIDAHVIEQTSGKKRNLLQLPNKWPIGFSSDAVDILEDLYVRSVDVANTLVGALSTMFTCDSQSTNGGEIMTLQSIVAGGAEISLMRMFHYYHYNSTLVQDYLSLHSSQSSPEMDDKVLLGSSPHTDWGFLTLIWADDARGLQFIPRGRDPNSRTSETQHVMEESDWRDVPYIPGSLIINSGDYLKFITNGTYHSPIHRVLIPSHLSSVSGGSEAADRYSFVLFFYPGYNASLSNTVLNNCRHKSIMESNFDKTYEDTQPVKEIPASSIGPPKFQYNTLIDGQSVGSTSEHSSHSLKFGDYVIEKWKGVFRA